jgi:hypothetical protein
VLDHQNVSSQEAQTDQRRLDSAESKYPDTTWSLPSPPIYFRRYLDWNRATFEYHSEGSQAKAFDTELGQAVSKVVDEKRAQLSLRSLYGCAPQSWCMTCRPFGHSGNIYGLLSSALSAGVVNETRASTPRLILVNTGNIRFDLPKGPFTYDDSFIVSPYKNYFRFIPDMSYSSASVRQNSKKKYYAYLLTSLSEDFSYSQQWSKIKEINSSI